LPLSLLQKGNNVQSAVPPPVDPAYYYSDLAQYSEAMYIRTYASTLGEDFKKTHVDINQATLDGWAYFTVHAINPTRYPVNTATRISEIAINNVLRKIIRHLVTRLEIQGGNYAASNPLYNFLSDPLWHLVRYLNHNETV